MNVPKGFKPSPEEEEERRKKELEKESQKKKQKALEEKRKKGEVEDSGKALSLEDLKIKEIGKLVDTLEEASKPGLVNDFNTYADNYRLTLENIKQAIRAEYKHKEKEEWMDIYMFEYKEEEKIEEDFLGLLFNQKRIIKDEANKEGENLRILVQDKYLVLIHNYSKELDKAAEKIFNGYKTEFGMQEIEAVYVRK